MTKAAAIMGSLVDARNVAAHKCLRLTVDVPVERALEVIEAFGWPTGVDPVTVAIARLNDKQASPANDTKPKATKEPASWHEMALPQQAGILCNDPVFHKFLQHWCAKDWRDFSHLPDAVQTATFCVRRVCNGITSRRELVPGTPAAEKWRELVSYYRGFVKEAEVV